MTNLMENSLKENKMINGEHIQTRIDGNWNGDKTHGKDNMIWSDGVMYEGEWKDGKINGKGIFTFPEGTIDFRNFINGDLEFGIRVYHEGTRYKGEFKGGKRHGLGVIYDVNNHVIQEGQWVEDDYIGKPLL